MADYLRPSFLYPAASAYQLANGVIQRFNHGLLTMNPASDGADMISDSWCWIEPSFVRSWAWDAGGCVGKVVSRQLKYVQYCIT